MLLQARTVAKEVIHVDHHMLAHLITKDPMDLRSIQQRATTRGAGSSFESFYNDSFKDGEEASTRGPKMAPVKVDEIKIVPFTYGIVKGSSK